MALKSVFSLSVSASGGNEAVPITVTPSLVRTEASENSSTVPEPWPLLTVTCARQVAAFSFLVPTSVGLASWNFPFEVPSATLRCHASHSWPGLVLASAWITWPRKTLWPLLSWAIPLPVFCTSQPLAGARLIPLPRSTPPLGGWFPVALGVGCESFVGAAVVDLSVGFGAGCSVGGAVLVGVIDTGAGWSLLSRLSTMMMPPTAASSTMAATTMPMISPGLFLGVGAPAMGGK